MVRFQVLIMWSPPSEMARELFLADVLLNGSFLVRYA